MKTNLYRHTILILLVVNLLIPYLELVHAKGGGRGKSSGSKGGISSGSGGGRSGEVKSSGGKGGIKSDGGGESGEVKNSGVKSGINSGGGVYAHGGSNGNKELFFRYVGIRICVSVFVMILISL